jgi:outer membrane immunogenic protein
MNLKALASGQNFTAGGGAAPPAVANEKENSAWYVGGRLGYLVTPNLLTFVSGGYTETRFGQRDYFNPATGVAFGSSVLAHNYHGGFFGSGVEYNLNLPWLPINGLFWRTEYRYADYRTDDLPIIITATGLPNGTILHDHKYVQTVTSSLVWRFNWTGTPVMAKY